MVDSGGGNLRGGRCIGVAESDLRGASIAVAIGESFATEENVRSTCEI
jgi:hypothetical protein